MLDALEQVKYLWKHEEVEILLLSLLMVALKVCPTVLPLWGLAVCREGTWARDQQCCWVLCSSSVSLLWMCYRQTRRKEQHCQQWGFPHYFLFNCCQLLVAADFFTAWPHAACPGCCPHSGCLTEARAMKHTLSIPAHLHLPELAFFSQFLQCSHDLEQGLGPWYACGKCLLCYLFPTWKKGVEGNGDSIPLKCNIFQPLLLSLLVMAGHHYSWCQGKACRCIGSCYEQKKLLEEDDNSGERLWRQEMHSFN